MEIINNIIKNTKDGFDILLNSLKKPIFILKDEI